MILFFWFYQGQAGKPAEGRQHAERRGKIKTGKFQRLPAAPADTYTRMNMAGKYVIGNG